MYQAACASIAAMAVSFRGITRPVPASIDMKWFGSRLAGTQQG
jgi:hypothetical protein